MSNPAPILTFAPKIDPEAPAWLRQHLTLIYQKLGNHTQAMNLLAQKSSGPTTNNKNIIETVNAISGGGGTNFAIGAVDNQSGVTAYATQSGDYGALLVFSDTSPIAVTLNSQSPPWFCFIANQSAIGAGTITLTPFSGTISYAGNPSSATMHVLPTYCALVAFDGTNWFAWTEPIVPVNTPSVLHQWVNAYNATTGAFSQTQPGFSDLSGQIDPSTQMPASGVTAGSYTLSSVTVNSEGLVTAASSGPTGLSVTITTAALTVGGTQGSQTFTDGTLTSQVQAT